MAKGSGGTRNSRPQTFEQQVDKAISGLRSDFFGKMDDFYEKSFERWQTNFAEFKEKDDYITGGTGGSVSAIVYDRREREAYGEDYNPRYKHYQREHDLRDRYSDLVSGAFGTDKKAPSFYDLKRGNAVTSSANNAVKATAQKTAEKKFADVRAKMLKTTLGKGIDPKRAKVNAASDEGFVITDGKVTLHARYVLAWGEVNAPHFRFIITDRK